MSTSDRTLYEYWRSSAAYRVRLALHFKQLDYASKPVDLLAGGQKSLGFTMINPQGFVPFLIDGDAGLNQSLAIMEYLDEAYPDTPRLLPDTPVARARVRAAAQIIACDIHPLNNLRVLKALKKDLGQEQDAIDAWYARWIGEGFQPLEEIIEGQQARAQPGGELPRYMFGDTPTLADLCLVPQMYNARRFRVNLEPFAHLVRIDAALNALDWVRAAAPEQQAQS